MCKPKGKIPINCDVFCFEDITRKHFGDINISGSLIINADGVFKANDITLGGDLISSNTSLNVGKVKITDNFISENPTLFDSLVVGETCIMGMSFYKPKNTRPPIDCDVFCVDGYLPQEVCITGNLYISNADMHHLTYIETGEDIFLESTSIDLYDIKSQGSIYTYGKKKKAFNFDSLIALEGCEIYSEIDQR